MLVVRNQSANWLVCIAHLTIYASCLPKACSVSPSSSSYQLTSHLRTNLQSLSEGALSSVIEHASTKLLANDFLITASCKPYHRPTHHLITSIKTQTSKNVALSSHPTNKPNHKSYTGQTILHIYTRPLDHIPRSMGSHQRADFTRARSQQRHPKAYAMKVVSSELWKRARQQRNKQSSVFYEKSQTSWKRTYIVLPDEHKSEIAEQRTVELSA